MEQKGGGEARISGEVFHGAGETVVAAVPERGDQRRAQQRQHAGGIGIAEAAAVFKAHGIPQPMDVILHRPVPADESGEERRTGLTGASARARAAASANAGAAAGWRCRCEAADEKAHAGFFDAALFVGHFAFGQEHALGVGKTDAFAADGLDGELPFDHFAVAAFRGADKKGVPCSWLGA